MYLLYHTQFLNMLKYVYFVNTLNTVWLLLVIISDIEQRRT